MAEDKKVSIIECFYNEEKYLAESIESVLAQTYGNFELILVNDGSTDRSDEIVRGYHDKRIVYISYTGNKRLAYARNRGLERTTGDYIGFFDGDDIMVPDKLEKQVEYLNKHQDIALISGGFSYMDREGKVDSEISKPVCYSDEQIKAYMLYGNCIACAGGALFRRELIDKFQIRFDESNNASEDYRFWIEMLPFGKFVNVDECFFYYRIGHGSKSSVIVKDEESYDTEVKKILERAWSMRGFRLDREDIFFIHEYLYKHTKVWRPFDMIRGIRIYKKIQKQLVGLDLEEGKLILQNYKRQWIRSYHIYWLIRKVMGITDK